MISAWLLLGLFLGAVFIAFARALDRAEIRVLASGLLVAALIYIGFAAVGGAGLAWLLIEVAGAVVYGALAWLGTRRSHLWLAVGWGLHPAWDAGLHLLGAGAPFTPTWYAVACISFDVAVAVYVGFWPRADRAAIRLQQ